MIFKIRLLKWEIFIVKNGILLLPFLFLGCLEKESPDSLVKIRGDKTLMKQISPSLYAGGKNPVVISPNVSKEMLEAYLFPEKGRKKSGFMIYPRLYVSGPKSRVREKAKALLKKKNNVTRREGRIDEKSRLFHNGVPSTQSEIWSQWEDKKDPKTFSRRESRDSP